MSLARENGGMEELIDSAIDYLRDLKRKQHSVLVSKPMLSAPKPIVQETPKPVVEVKAVKPPPPKKRKLAPKREEIVLEKQSSPVDISPSNTMQSLISGALPNLFLHTKVPDDRMARRMATEWKDKTALPEVPVLVTRELTPHRNFLKGLAHAIDRQFGPSRAIEISKYETENRWETVLSSETVRLIIIPDIILWKMPNLLAHYKECPGEPMRRLGSVKTLLLPDLSLYQKDPKLKRGLWSLIKNELQ